MKPTISVADTGPLRYLVAIGEIQLLPALFGKVLVPDAVLNEITHPNAPLHLLNWAQYPPDWVELKIVSSPFSCPRLGKGECSAIGLALEVGAEVIMLDDRDARKAAVIQGLNVIGTIGILELGARSGRLNMRSALKKLLATNFRISKNYLHDVLRRHTQ